MAISLSRARPVLERRCGLVSPIDYGSNCGIVTGFPAPRQPGMYMDDGLVQKLLVPWALVCVLLHLLVVAWLSISLTNANRGCALVLPPIMYGAPVRGESTIVILVWAGSWRCGFVS
jgi:hypothetical protein